MKRVSLVDMVNESFGVVTESVSPELMKTLSDWNVTNIKENTDGSVTIEQDVTVPYWKPNLALPRGIRAIKGNFSLKNTQISTLENLTPFIFGDLDLSGCKNITEESFRNSSREGYGGISGNVNIKGTNIDSASIVVDTFKIEGNVIHDKNIMFGVDGRLTNPVKDLQKSYDDVEKFREAYNKQINKIGEKVSWSADTATHVSVALIRGVDAKFAQTIEDYMELTYSWYKPEKLNKTKLKKYIGVAFPTLFEHNLTNLTYVWFTIMQDVNFGRECTDAIREMQKNHKFYELPRELMNFSA